MERAMDWPDSAFGVADRWIPACAGMTTNGESAHATPPDRVVRRHLEQGTNPHQRRTLVEADRAGGRGRQRTDLQIRSEEHTSELQSHVNLVCRLLLEK